MIAGGGTGGHIYPGIAMYEALRRFDDTVDVLFVGAKVGVENKVFAELGVRHVLLPGRGVRGKSLFARLTSPLILFIGIVRGIREMLVFKPDVVIGTGGYASVAAVAASILCRRKTVLQEQNSVPGMANRLFSRFADLVLLSYGESKRYLTDTVPTAVVGNPIRVDGQADRDSGFRFFALTPGIPTVLICGGSRGARSINTASMAAIRRVLAKRDVQFVFLTGELDHETVVRDLEEFTSRVRIYPFLREMHHAYSVADIAVSRAGASAVFELAAFGVPTVFVPYPYAADDHQAKNVARLRELGGATVVDDSELTGEQLQRIIEMLLDDHDRRGRMVEEMKKWAMPDADDLAAEKIIELVSRRTLRTTAGYVSTAAWPKEA